MALSIKDFSGVGTGEYSFSKQTFPYRFEANKKMIARNWHTVCGGVGGVCVCVCPSRNGDVEASDLIYNVSTIFTILFYFIFCCSLFLHFIYLCIYLFIYLFIYFYLFKSLRRVTHWTRGDLLLCLWVGPRTLNVTIIKGNIYKLKNG